MSSANVFYLHARTAHDPAPRDARVIPAFAAALARLPPRPMGVAACVAWLQESPEDLRQRQMALRALQGLRDSLFVAPGRDAEMALLWREAVATACFARALARDGAVEAPLLTGAGLLHRAGEVAALRALAQAERDTGERLLGPVLQEILDAGDDELASRVTRSWGLPGEMRLTIIRWREEQNSLVRPLPVTLLMMAQALTTELVHAATCTPGLVDAACESLRLSPQMVAQARNAGEGIAALLPVLAPPCG